MQPTIEITTTTTTTTFNQGCTFSKFMVIFSPMSFSEIFELFPNFMRKSRHFWIHLKFPFSLLLGRSFPFPCECLCLFPSPEYGGGRGIICEESLLYLIKSLPFQWGKGFPGLKGSGEAFSFTSTPHKSSAIQHGN